MELSVFLLRQLVTILSLHLDLIALYICLINKILMVCHTTLHQSALIAQTGIIKVVAVQAET